jgi:hypothetical protein
MKRKAGLKPRKMVDKSQNPDANLSLINPSKNDRPAVVMPTPGSAAFLFFLYSLSHLGLFVAILVLEIPLTTGSVILLVAALSLVWDNGMLAIGTVFFFDCESNPDKLWLLNLLSQVVKPNPNPNPPYHIHSRHALIPFSAP